MSSEEENVEGRLRESAAHLRRILLPSKTTPSTLNLRPKSNVAVAEVYANCVSFCLVATSNIKSPIPQPIPKSQGGQFEPQLDPYSGRTMDTDAEYKILSEIAVVLEMQYNQEIPGNIYLYTELFPCKSCQSVIQQFKEKFIHMEVKIFYDYPYPPSSESGQTHGFSETLAVQGS